MLAKSVHSDIGRDQMIENVVPQMMYHRISRVTAYGKEARRCIYLVNTEETRIDIRYYTYGPYSLRSTFKIPPYVLILWILPKVPPNLWISKPHYIKPKARLKFDKPPNLWISQCRHVLFLCHVQGHVIKLWYLSNSTNQNEDLYKYKDRWCHLTLFLLMELWKYLTLHSYKILGPVSHMWFFWCIKSYWI